MASQEEKVEGGEQELTAAEDTAKFSEAWDELDGKERQPDTASGRDDDPDGKSQQGGSEAGQGAAETGQSDAGTTPGTDASASRGETTDDGTRSAPADELSKAREEARRAENLARSNAGRLAKALNELNALKQQLSTKAGGSDGEASDEEVEKLKQDYPEIADPLLKRIDKLTEQVGALSSTATARAESEVADALTGEAEALAGRHSDFTSIVKEPEYAEWLKGQPPAIQRIVQENSQAIVSADDCDLVFSRYKSFKAGSGETEAQKAAGAAEERRKAQLEAGRSATGGSQPGIRSDAGGNDSYDDEWDRLERQAKAKSANRR
jgi:hypothetical protein